MNLISCSLVAAMLAMSGCAGTEAASSAATRRDPGAAARGFSADPAGPALQAGLLRSSDAYYFGSCAACGGRLGARGDTIDRPWQGRDLRFCGTGCGDAFGRDPEAGLARLDRVMIADQAPLYPIAVSLVSGEDLGPSPVDFIWGNRLFRVASAGERERVLADPSRFIALLDLAVIDAQTPGYGMPTKCPVQGDTLASDVPLDIVVANRMIRVCCGRCARVVRARPSQFLSMVEYANRDAAARRGSPESEER